MARKRAPAKRKVPEADSCDHCDATVLRDGPMSGVIAQVGPNLLVICGKCAIQLVTMHKQMHNRWG